MAGLGEDGGHRPLSGQDVPPFRRRQRTMKGIAGLQEEERRTGILTDRLFLESMETEMKLAIVLSALAVGFVAASTEEARAVVYCQYINYPVGCVVRPGVVLRPRPVARAVVTPGVGARGVGVRPGTPMNRGGPVNRVGRR